MRARAPIRKAVASRTLGLALPLLLLLPGCSIRRLAVNSLGSALAGSGDVFASDDDPELVREALPFALKTMEALLAESPKNRDLLLGACKSFVQYAYAFVDTDGLELEASDYRASQRAYERALKLELRGRDYCLRSLELDAPGIRGRLERQPEVAAAELGAKDLDLLYWTAASWGAAISRGLDRPDIVVDLPAVRALMERVLELDESYGQGAAHEAMISLEAVPEAMGGSPERARRQFERAVELAAGKRAGTYVSFAVAVAVPAQDVKEFQQLLQKALAVDVDADPSERVANLVAQKRARLLLERTADLFYAYEGD